MSEGNKGVGFIIHEATFESRPKILDDNGKIVRFESVLQDTSPNRNKRLYRENVLNEAIRTKSVEERLRTRTMYGEAGHPASPDLKRQTSIDHSRISHLITELCPVSNGRLCGKVETAATRIGQDMRGLIVENGSVVGFSLRGAGKLERVPGKNLNEVKSPLAIITYDWVTLPSHTSAYMMSEDVSTSSAEHLVQENEIASFIEDNSENAKVMLESFGTDSDPSILGYDPKEGMTMVVGKNEIAATFLERNLRRDVHDYILSFIGD